MWKDCWTLVRNWYRENCNTSLWCRNIETKITGRIENFQKRKLFDRAYVPPKNCQFPFRIVSGSRRKFNSKWSKEFSWLAYSPSSDKGFCKVCTLFDNEVKHETNTTIRILFSESLTAKKYSYSCLKDHDAWTWLHKKAMENYNLMMMQTSSKSMAIEENVQITSSKNQL